MVRVRVAVSEGHLSFRGYQTWYRLAGDLKSGITPVILIHGGPGAPSEYMEPLQRLTASYNIPTIIYDQVGNGKSTHLPDKRGDASFWTVDLFKAELDNLIQKLGIGHSYSILGQSWGGMLALEHAIDRPKGLERLVISNSLATMNAWVDAGMALRLELPQDAQDKLNKHERDGTTESDEYQEAVQVFFKRHMCLLDPWPDSLNKSLELMKADDTVYWTMMGTSEFFVTGNLKDWSVINKIHKINVPTLVINGEHDQSQDSVSKPIYAAIPGASWEKIANASHVSHLERPNYYLKLVGEFFMASAIET